MVEFISIKKVDVVYTPKNPLENLFPINYIFQDISDTDSKNLEQSLDI